MDGRWRVNRGTNGDEPSWRRGRGGEGRRGGQGGGAEQGGKEGQGGGAGQGGREEREGRGRQGGRNPGNECGGRDRRLGNDNRVRDTSRDRGRRNDTRREFEMRKMGFKQAKALAENEDVEEIVQKVFNDRSGFRMVLDEKHLSGDWLCLIVHILSKVSRSSFLHSKLNIYESIFKNSTYTTQLREFVLSLPYQEEREKKSNGFFWNDTDVFWMELIEIFKDVITIPTLASETLPNLLKAIVNAIPSIQNEQSILIAESIKKEFSDLKYTVGNMKKTMEGMYHTSRPTINNKYMDNEDDLVPPEDFRTISVLPNVQEVTCRDTPFLRVNKLKGAYKTIDHYLDVQFRLLREDFVKPLREGICQFFDDPKLKRFDSIKIHQPVHFLKEENLNELKCYRIKYDFSAKKKALKFENSKQFMFGSLVCLSRDRFANLLFAKIVNKDADMIKNGELIIGFEDNRDMNIVFNVDYIMVESKVYFEPYYHVLTAMQKMPTDGFPMKDYIVFGKSTVNCPSYIDHNTTFNIHGKVVYPSQGIHWGIIEGLNDSQRIAFRAALTREISVIQGPPGTGKTFLGLIIADTLLKNQNAWFKNTPMLVICFTNHALDQFLEEITKSTQRLLRIGGQSKNENLQQYNLGNIKRGKRSAAYHQAQQELNISLGNLKVCDSIINEIRQYEGIVDFACLEGSSDWENRWYKAATKQQIKEWLFEGITGYVPPTPVSQWVKPVLLQQDSDDDEVSDFSEDEEEARDEEYAHMLKSHGSSQICNVRYAVSIASVKEEIAEKMLKGRNLAGVENKLRKLRNELKFLENKMDDLRNDRIPYPNNDNLMATPFSLSHDKRWSVYHHFIKQYLSLLTQRRADINRVYREKYNIYTEQRDMEDVKIMRENLVIGMTTTSAARLKPTLEALKSPIVIVEEAAEVLEAHLISALTKHCQQLILIGDHQQLRPSTADYKVETQYKMGISLFERLVQNDVECYTLNVQHRMRPEICDLIRPAIYEKLQDHESVSLRESIKGMDRNLFFLTHKHKEESCGDSTKKNLHEAKFLIRLAKHLVLNGYKPHQITILAAYLGQMFEMQREKAKSNLLLKDVRISVLDNYQGEESDIILLSLVRSNDENKNGFLKITNRVCVALSRAKNGLYIMGNMDQLCCDSGSIWHKIKATLAEKKALGDSLQLRCQIHDAVSSVKKEQDFNKAPEGGCLRPCNAQLPDCSHLCKNLCHLDNRSHEGYHCMELCKRELCTRSEDHICLLKCYEECAPCHYPVKWKLACDHSITMQCHENPNEYKCIEPVETLLSCGHTEQKPCHVKPEDFLCPVDCTAMVDCGHVCTLKCHDRRDPDHLSYKCPKPCSKLRAGCSTNHHECRNICHEKCEPCEMKVKKRRTVCTHVFEVPCNSDVDLIICTKPCKRTLLCGHPCKNKCNETCGPCGVKVNKVIAACRHEVVIECSKEPSLRDCQGKCKRRLACGHVCANLCKLHCTTKCEEVVPCQLDSPCDHVVRRIKCFELPIRDPELLLKYCSVPCKTALQCEHECSGTCGECSQGRVHVRCRQKCGVPMVCGHECPIPCRVACRPCEKKCSYRCDHGHCPKRCGEACAMCQESCSRRCPHQHCTRKCSELCSVPACSEPCPKKLPCGHECVGFCGDPCPALCGVCHKEELTEVFFGTEEDEGARFVQLKDCGHVLESSGIEEWLKEEKKAEIQMKVCPRCKTPILNTRRYSDYLKMAISDIQMVKNRLNGTPEENESTRLQLLQRLKEMDSDTLAQKFRDFPKFFAILKETESRLDETKVDKDRGRIRQSFNAILLRSLTSKVQILEHIARIGDLRIESTESQNQLHFILDCVHRNKEHITNQDIDDIQMEMSRLKRLIELNLMKQKYSTSKGALLDTSARRNASNQSIVEHIDVLISTRKRYTTTTDESVHDLMKKLDTGLEISEPERLEIVQALDMRQGHWFKCPNGHLYVITECGGAMQEARCPVEGCREPVGGTQHTLLGSNRLATEMDGASHAAWSDVGNRMGNYDLRFLDD